MDQPDLQELLAEQTRYYRARAGTYDLDMAWDSAEPELRALFAPVDAWFAELPIDGQVLELACGTGAWTRRLAARAAHVHAIDAAPEMIEQARRKVAGAGRVTFEVADLHHWQPTAAYDVVFFSFLLTHVPPPLTSRFWQVVASALARDGMVAFVDAAPHRHDEEEWLGDGVVRRTLRDGSEHRIVKVFPTGEQIRQAMADQGLRGTIDVASDRFLLGAARHAGARR